MAPCPEVRKIIKERARGNHQHLEELNRLQMRVEEAIDLWESVPDRPPDRESAEGDFQTVVVIPVNNSAPETPMRRPNLTVEDMTCMQCATRVESALRVIDANGYGLWSLALINSAVFISASVR